MVITKHGISGSNSHQFIKTSYNSAVLHVIIKWFTRISYVSTALVITNDPPSGIIFRPLHSQIHITCHVDRIDSIYWILVPPQQEGYMQITSSDTRFVISGESMETLTVVDFSEDLNRAHIFCQIPYHGDIDIGGFQLGMNYRMSLCSLDGW